MFGDGRFRHLDLGTTSANTCMYSWTAVRGHARIFQLVAAKKAARRSILRDAKG